MEGSGDISLVRDISSDRDILSNSPRGFLVGQTTRGKRRRSGRGYRPPSYAVPEHTQTRRDLF